MRNPKLNVYEDAAEAVRVAAKAYKAGEVDGDFLLTVADGLLEILFVALGLDTEKKGRN